MGMSDVLHSTPFKMLTKYAIPADLPACPEEGCICVVRGSFLKLSTDADILFLQWGWVRCSGLLLYSQTNFLSLETLYRFLMGKYFDLDMRKSLDEKTAAAPLTCTWKPSAAK